MTAQYEHIPESSERTSLHWLRNFLLLIIIGFTLWKILPVLMGIIIMFIVALLFAYLLEPLVSNLENRGLPRSISIILLLVAIGIALYICGYFLFDPIKIEIIELINTIRGGKIYATMDKIKSFIVSNFPSVQEEQIDQALRDSLIAFQNEVLNIAQRILSLIQEAFSLITQIIIVPLIAFFILKDGPKLKRDLIGLIPNKYFEMSLHMIYQTDQQIGKYIRGQLLDTMILSILYSLGFSLLGIPYYIVLGAFSAIANIIPYVGPIFSAIPPIIVLIIETNSFSQIPLLILLFVIIQIIEIIIIQPMVVAKSVNLHPLIVIFSVLAGGQMLGIIGMLFAVLLAGVIKVIILEIAWGYRNYHLGRR